MPSLRLTLAFACLALMGCATESGPDPGDADPPLGEPLGLQLPRVGITASELGVIVNTDDPLSAQIADRYMMERDIPDSNRLEVALGTEANLPRTEFVAIQDAIAAAFDDEVQAIALTSMLPQTVDCMGVSAAVAVGFDERWCQPGPPCNQTARADTYDSPSTTPFTEHGIRPTMILAAETLEDAESLIARGVASDGTLPGGSGHFVRTSDTNRSTRWEAMQRTALEWGDVLDLSYVDNADGGGSDLIEGEDDILFYLTGLEEVGGIATNSYRPGALADHLTSFGGEVPVSSQMSVLAWLQAGATASYGTAIEPCNYTTKFPDPEVLIPRYLSGATAVEAYWASVWMPGEGNFVGEPLARPFGGAVTTYEDGLWTIVTTNLVLDQRYQLQVSEGPDGPWEEVRRVEVLRLGFQTIEVEDPIAGWYRFEED